LKGKIKSNDKKIISKINV